MVVCLATCPAISFSGSKKSAQIIIKSYRGCPFDKEIYCSKFHLVVLYKDTWTRKNWYTEIDSECDSIEVHKSKYASFPLPLCGVGFDYQNVKHFYHCQMFKILKSVRKVSLYDFYHSQMWPLIFWWKLIF